MYDEVAFVVGDLGQWSWTISRSVSDNEEGPSRRKDLSNLMCVRGHLEGDGVSGQEWWVHEADRQVWEERGW